MRGDRASRARRRLVLACAVALLLAVPVTAPVGSSGAARASLAVPAASGPAPTTAAPAAPTVAATAPEPEPEPEPPTPPRTGLPAAAVAAAEATAGGSTQLAVAVLDRATGEMAVGVRGSEPIYTASLSKVVVVVDMLDRRRHEGLVISAADLDLVQRALGSSDDNAMNALWTRFDGAHAAGRVSERLGLTGTHNPTDQSQWGEMLVPAADTVQIWRYILDGIPATDRDVMISAMQDAPAQAHDGFDQTFGLLVPAIDGAGEPGAVAKQGWMCCFAGRYYLHSAGAVGADQRFVVALLTTIPRGRGWEAARQELDRIAMAAVHAVA